MYPRGTRPVLLARAKSGPSIANNAGFGGSCAAPPAVPQMQLPAVTFCDTSGASNGPGFVT